MRCTCLLCSIFRAFLYIFFCSIYSEWSVSVALCLAHLIFALGWVWACSVGSFLWAFGLCPVSSLPLPPPFSLSPCPFVALVFEYPAYPVRDVLGNSFGLLTESGSPDPLRFQKKKRIQ